MKRLIKSFSVIISICCLLGSLIITSSAYNIQNNGVDGLYIDINSAPYTTLAQVPTWGQYAYGPSGCAWFASARAKELTGKNIQTIYSGASWYNTAYSYFGFIRSSIPQGKSLACWTNHVAVVERVYGDNVTISEGGYTSGNSNSGYCIIRSDKISKIEAGNTLTGDFLGYIYLGVGDVSSAPNVYIDKSTTFAGTDTTFSFNAVNATSVHLYIYQGTDKYFEGEFSSNDTYTRQFFQTGHYSCYIVAHTSSGDIESAWLGFDVVNKPTVSISNLKTTIWTDTTFSFNAENATSVHLYIYQGTDKYFEGEFSPADTYIRQFGDATGYYCYIVAHYSWGDVESAKVYFDVHPKTYELIYDANGGTGAPSPQTKTYGQTLTLSSTKPTRSGYTFLGWSASSTATKATYTAGGSFTENANTTLYAVWQKNHSHSYTGTVTKAPTCTETGVRTYKCSCGASYTQTISATGHTESDWFIDYSATVEYSGSKHKECTVCGEVLETAVIPQLKCATPKLTKVANTVSGVKVTWGAVEGADSYRVYRRAGGVYTWSYIGTTTDTSFTDSKATNNKYWIYTVIAVNEAGYSGFDKVGKTVKCVTAPKITSVSNTASGLYMKWNAVPGAKEYRVYRKGLNYKTWMYLGTTKNTWFTDSPIKNANGYYYKYTVIAVNDYYSGFYEDCAFTKRLSNPVLKSAVSSKTGITVKWNSVYGSTGYYVYRKTANSGWTLVGSTKGTNNATYVDKTAKKGVTYTYTVRAYYGKTLSSYNSGISCKDKY